MLVIKGEAKGYLKAVSQRSVEEFHFPMEITTEEEWMDFSTPVHDHHRSLAQQHFPTHPSQQTGYMGPTPHHGQQLYQQTHVSNPAGQHVVMIPSNELMAIQVAAAAATAAISAQQMQRRGSSPIMHCAVCGDRSSGMHYGVQR